jgi:SAM-dependent methyltransferase
MVSMDESASNRSAAFYDSLAHAYDRLYPDWGEAIAGQGRALHELVTARLGPGPHRILDAAAGIGTQLIGLAAHGHEVAGSDLSRTATRRAQAECARRHTPAALAVADLRALPFADGSFDAVLCIDNALAHLMDAEEVTRGLRELGRVARPGGVVLVSTRDYEQARAEHPPGTLPQVWRRAGEETVSFQVWDWWDDGAHYDLQHYQLVDEAGAWVVVRRLSALWAITQHELTDCATRAGLTGISTLSPERSGFFQPILLATRAVSR